MEFKLCAPIYSLAARRQGRSFKHEVEQLTAITEEEANVLSDYLLQMDERRKVVDIKSTEAFWDLVARLQWTDLSDRNIAEEPRLQQQVLGLLTKSEYAKFQIELETFTNKLLAHISRIHADLNRSELSRMVQHAVLKGEQFYNAAFEDPLLLSYLENELQPIELFTLRRQGCKVPEREQRQVDARIGLTVDSGSDEESCGHKKDSGSDGD